MRELLRSWIAASCLLLTHGVFASAQQQAPTEKAGEALKAPEPKRAEREGGSQTVAYTLAAIGTIIVMVLVCMPARRE